MLHGVLRHTPCLSCFGLEGHGLHDLPSRRVGLEMVAGEGVVHELERLRDVAVKSEPDFNLRSGSRCAPMGSLRWVCWDGLHPRREGKFKCRDVELRIPLAGGCYG